MNRVTAVKSYGFDWSARFGLSDVTTAAWGRTMRRFGWYVGLCPSSEEYLAATRRH